MSQTLVNQENLEVTIEYLKYHGPLFIRLNIESNNSERLACSQSPSVIY